MLVALLALCSCGTPPQNLTFTPLTSDNPFTPLGGYDKEAPALVVIASPQDLITPDLGIHFALGLNEPLRALDYSHKFAILVLQGLKPTGGYEVRVQQVIRQGDCMAIHADFVEPGTGTRVTTGFTSPYQLITITKDATWEPVTQVELIVQGKTLAEATHRIP